MEEMNFNTQHVFKDIVSVDKLLKVFFFFILNSESLQSENEEKNFIIYPCIKIFFVIYDVLMVFKVDLIITGISSNK